MQTSPEEVLKAQRSLSVWSGTKKIAGVLVIVAIVLMIVSAVVALRSEADTSRAMKVPFCLALFLSALFLHSDKRIRGIEAKLRR